MFVKEKCRLFFIAFVLSLLQVSAATSIILYCFLEQLYRNFSFNSMVTCGMSNFLIAKAKHDC